MLSLILGLLLRSSPVVTSESICFNSDLAGWKAPQQWAPSVHRYFKHPMQVWIHGGEQGGRWYVYGDYLPPIPADWFARGVKSVFPTKDIILCSCNAAGLELNVSDVYYAKHIVWCRPGPEHRRLSTRMQMEYGEGQIEGFRAK